jgi:protein SCO1
MQKFLKTGLLLFMLVIPVFVYVFLRVFGDNKYRLPVFHPVGLDTASVSSGRPDTIYHTIPSFSYPTPDGAPISRENLAGKVHVANFCSLAERADICSRIHAQLRRINELFANKPQVLIVSYTDDSRLTESLPADIRNQPETPAPQQYYLLASADELSQLAQQGYRLPAGRTETSETGAENTGETLVLVDGLGRIRGYYDGMNHEDVDRLILEITILLTETNTGS